MKFKIVRIVILFLKLIPILFFPYFFSPKDIGLYGVILGYISTFIYLVGFEFWFIYNREFTVVKTLEEKQEIIKQQNSHYFINYIFVLPIFIIVLFDFNLYLICYSVLILIFYHLAQELNRIFIHLEEHLISSIIQFIQSSWVFLLPLGLVKSINALFLSLLVFSFLAFIYGVYSLYNRHNIKYVFVLNKKIRIDDYQNVFLIMINALLLKCMFFLPRFIFEYFNHLKEAGIFTYFQSISMVIEYFSYFFIQAIFMPSLLKDKENKDLKNKFIFQMISGNVLLFFLTILGTFVLTKFIIKDGLYYSYIGIACIIILSTTIVSISNSFSSLNYVNHDDVSYKKAVFYSFVFSIPIYLGGILFFSDNLVFGVSLAFLLYSVIVLVTRGFYAKKYI